jgi:hypothetical protein
VGLGGAMLHAGPQQQSPQQQQQHPGMLDAKSLLLRKEQEVASLRESALAQLEAQVGRAMRACVPCHAWGGR